MSMLPVLRTPRVTCAMSPAQEEEGVQLLGVEAGGRGLGTAKHAATLTKGSPGVLHGSFSYLLQDSDGQVNDPHSISPGCGSPLQCLLWQSGPLCLPASGKHPASLAADLPVQLCCRVPTGYRLRPALTRCSCDCRLDYPGVGPEHSHLKDIGRAVYVSATDAQVGHSHAEARVHAHMLWRLRRAIFGPVWGVRRHNAGAEAAAVFATSVLTAPCCMAMSQALEAFRLLSRTEGIIPALETSHAIAHLQVVPTKCSAGAVCLWSFTSL